MIIRFHHNQRHFVYRLLSAFVALTFAFSLVTPPAVYAQTAPSVLLNLPAPGSLVPLSTEFTPAIVRGMTLYPDDPLRFDFIIDPGDDHLQGEALQSESKKLINYFLATLTVPEEEMWVNLSPYEKDRIIADGLSVTDMGRDMLIQDYLLKQVTASLMYPEEDIGSEFWKRVYAKAQAKFGTTEIPTNTFNKVWIIPEDARVYVHGMNVFVSESRLKVMLEEDYLALESNADRIDHGLGNVTANEIGQLSQDAKDIIRQILIPEIEKEVNEGKNFANLRQIYNSMILATWYKQNLKDSFLGKVYLNQNKVEGIDIDDKQVKEKVYQQYVEAFKKGVYDYIREDYNPTTQEVIPRKYFSGGLIGVQKEVTTDGEEASSALIDLLQESSANGRTWQDNVVKLDILDAVKSGIVAASPLTEEGRNNAQILGIDEAKVVELSEKNKRTNYGMTVAMGHPFSGEGQSKIEQWDREISTITAGKFRLNTNFIHATVGAILRSQTEPIRDEQLEEIDLDGIRNDVLRAAKPFKISFQEVLLSPGQEGNLVLRGEAPADANLSEIKRQMAERGASLKWKAPSDPTQPTPVFVTLGHINIEILESLDKEEAEGLHAWINNHKNITPFEVKIDRFKIVTYNQRELKSTIKPDEELQLVSSPVTPGGIDFNANNLDLQMEGQTITFTTPLHLQNINPGSVEGLVPVVLNSSPIINFVPLLGFAIPEGENETSDLGYLGILSPFDLRQPFKMEAVA